MTLTGLEVSGALAVLAVGIWIRRIAQFGTIIKASVLVSSVLAAFVLLGVVEVSVHPGRLLDVVQFGYETISRLIQQ